MWLWSAAIGGSLLILLAAAPSRDAAAPADGPGAQPPERAVWIWGKTVREEGAEQVAARLAEARIDTALLLVKGVSGGTNFASASALKRDTQADVLQAMLDACHPRGIRVHAWLIFHGDSAWVAAHPGDAMHSCGATADALGPTRASDEKVCPAAPDYRAYLLRLTRELLAAYAVDGVHLDCIRYPTLASCFCPRHRENARQAGIDFDKVRQAALKSSHDRAARDLFVTLYRQEDLDIRRWVDMRRAEIDSFVRDTAQVIAETRPAAQLSAALMPEGAAEDDAFALCHYAQDYRTFGAACGFICPMSYHASYDQPATWPVDIAARAAQRAGCPVLAGLQAFEPSTPTDLGTSLRELQRRNRPGFVLFSYAAMTPERWAQLGE